MFLKIETYFTAQNFVDMNSVILRFLLKFLYFIG